MATSAQLLGRGWRFPFALDDHDEIAYSEGEDDIQEAIWIILSTAFGERLMHPDFGCGIHDLVFAPNNTGTAGLARFYVDDALVRWEPRIDVEEVEVQADPAATRAAVDQRELPGAHLRQPIQPGLSVLPDARSSGMNTPRPLLFRKKTPDLLAEIETELPRS